MPAHCAPEMYETMKQCWDVDPQARPTAAEVRALSTVSSTECCTVLCSFFLKSATGEWPADHCSVLHTHLTAGTTDHPFFRFSGGSHQ